MASGTDMSGLLRQTAAVRKAAEPTAIAATRGIAHAAISVMTVISPRDTNRYQRAWAIANNAIAGVPQLPVLPLKESKYAAQNEARLDKQVRRFEKLLVRQQGIAAYWQGILRDRYTIPGRTGRWTTITRGRVQKAEKVLDKFAVLLRRAQDERDIYEASVKSGGSPLLIGGRRGKQDASGKFKIGANQLTTVRARVYGGDIREQVASGKYFITATNREPHASIVESRLRVVKRANAIAGVSAQARMGRAIVVRIAEAAKVG